MEGTGNIKHTAFKSLIIQKTTLQLPLNNVWMRLSSTSLGLEKPNENKNVLYETVISSLSRSVAAGIPV